MADTATTQQIVEIPLDQLHIAGNVRSTYNDESLDELAQSIKANGVLEPLRVYANGDGFRVESGSRRYLASERAGKATAPCIIVDAEGSKKASIDELIRGLVTNVQREDLNPVDEGETYRDLVVKGVSIDGIVERTGKSKRVINARLDLIELPKEVVDIFRAGGLPVSTRPSLRAVADVSPELAVAAAQMCDGKAEFAAVLAEQPGRVLGFVAKQDDQGRWFDATDPVPLDQVASKKQLAEVEELRKTGYFQPRLNSTDIEQAVTMKVAIADSGVTVIVDPKWLVEMVPVLIEREVKRREEATRQARAASMPAGGGTPEKPVVDKTDAEIAEEARVADFRRRVNLARKEGQAIARDANAALYKATLDKLGQVDVGPMPKALEQALAEALVGPSLADLVLQGLRYCDPQLVVAEVKGEGDKQRTTYEYLQTKEKAVAAGQEFLGRAKNSGEFLGRALCLAAMAMYADQGVVPGSQRAGNPSYTLPRTMTSGQGQTEERVHALLVKYLPKAAVPVALRKDVKPSEVPVVELLNADPELAAKAGLRG